MSHPSPRSTAGAAAGPATTAGLRESQAAGRVRAALPRATRRCLLRPVTAGDAGALRSYRGLEQVTRFLGHPPLDPAGMERALAGWLADDAAVSVAVELDGQLVGDVRLSLRPAHALPPATTTEVEGRLGYAFSPAVHGRGLATEAVREVVGLGLGPGAVRRVTARVFAPATPSSRLLRRLGFRLDGVDRASVLAPDGRTWWDDECWSLLREEWGEGAPSFHR